MASTNIKQDKMLTLEESTTLIALFSPFSSTWSEEQPMCLAQALYNNGFDLSSTEPLIRELTGNERYKTYYKGEIESLYADMRLPNIAEESFQELLLEDDYKELLKILHKEEAGAVVLQTRLGDTKEIICDPHKRQIIMRNLKRQGKRDLSTEEVMVNACPYEINVYDSILTEQPRSFEITWFTWDSKKKFKTTGELGSGSIQEISAQLESAGYVWNSKNLKGIISVVISAYITSDLAEIKKEVETPGFFWDSIENKIVAVKYDNERPTVQELQKALELLDELAVYFKDEEQKLGTVIKWACISPFTYAKKQIGDYIHWLYLYGSAGSGKTVLGKIGLHCHESPNTENNKGGNSFNTDARMGAVLSRSTYPILINEPASLFQRKSVMEMMKNAVDNTIARSKYVNNVYQNIHAFSTVMFTSNVLLPVDDGVDRRLYKIKFTPKQRKATSKLQNEFDNKFRVNAEDSPLQKLKALGNFFIHELLTEPELLKQDWKDISDMIIQRAYIDAGRKEPDWIYDWEEQNTLEDFDEEMVENIRMFFIETINKHITQDIEREKMIDDELSSKTTDFSDMLWRIINERKIPWLVPHINKRKGNMKEVYVRMTIKRDLKDYIDTCLDLASIGELLGWDYRAVRLSKGANPSKALVVYFSQLLEFVYPEAEEEDG